MTTKKPTQAMDNPFPFSDSNKRYHTFDYALRQKFGHKCAKIILDAGMTCPNIDGTCGVGGCIYCSPRGSGDFACSADMPLLEQYTTQQEKMRTKWNVTHCIPYLQAHSNTYAPVEKLRAIYQDIITFPDAVALHIATRADCISEACAELLAEIAEKIPLTVELGLQSAKDQTAKLINRGHTFSDFVDGFSRLRGISTKIGIGIHIINGLPTEHAEDMIDTIKEVARLHPNEVKIHLLHILKGTPIARLWDKGLVKPLTLEEYVDIVVRQLEFLPANIVIGRITGDGAEEELLAPTWSKKKLCVSNAIDKELFLRKTWQGKEALGNNAQ